MKIRVLLSILLCLFIFIGCSSNKSELTTNLDQAQIERVNDPFEPVIEQYFLLTMFSIGLF